MITTKRKCSDDSVISYLIFVAILLCCLIFLIFRHASSAKHCISNCWSQPEIRAYTVLHIRTTLCLLSTLWWIPCHSGFHQVTVVVVHCRQWSNHKAWDDQLPQVYQYIMGIYNLQLLRNNKMADFMILLSLWNEVVMNTSRCWV